MTDPIHRIDTALPIDDVVKKTTLSFQLGDVLTYSVIPTGYQEYNIDCSTSSGRFIVKIFSHDKPRSRIEDVIWGYTRFASLGAPFPALKTQQDSGYILEIPAVRQAASYLCVFEYFAGKPMTHVAVTDADLITITETLITIHKTKKTIGRYYDTLGITNLETEFEKKGAALFPDETALIKPVIAKLHKLRTSSFRQSIIHGSIEKENILKNAAGSVCVLDLGCMDYNASVCDIATYIANFSSYLPEAKRVNAIHLILSHYQKSLPLAPEELAALPTLIRAQYAAYIVGMTHHMRKDHDMSKQTQTWLDRGWDGLRAYTNVKSLI